MSLPPRTDRDEIRAERAAGQSLTAIGAPRGLSRQRVHQILTRPDPPLTREPRRVIRDADALLAMYTIGCKSVPEIAAYFGRSPPTVARVLRELGARIEYPPSRWLRTHGRDEIEAAVAELGETITALRYGVATPTLHAFRRRPI